MKSSCHERDWRSCIKSDFQDLHCLALVIVVIDTSAYPGSTYLLNENM